MLWRSQISGSDESTRMLTGAAFLDSEIGLFLSNDQSRGALIHSVNTITGATKVWTLLAGKCVLVMFIFFTFVFFLIFFFFFLLSYLFKQHQKNIQDLDRKWMA